MRDGTASRCTKSSSCRVKLSATSSLPQLLCFSLLLSPPGCCHSFCKETLAAAAACCCAGVLYYLLARMVLQMRGTVTPANPWDVMVSRGIWVMGGGGCQGAFGGGVGGAMVGRVGHLCAVWRMQGVRQQVAQEHSQAAGAVSCGGSSSSLGPYSRRCSGGSNDSQHQCKVGCRSSGSSSLLAKQLLRSAGDCWTCARSCLVPPAAAAAAAVLSAATGAVSAAAAACHCLQCSCHSVVLRGSHLDPLTHHQQQQRQRSMATAVQRGLSSVWSPLCCISGSSSSCSIVSSSINSSSRQCCDRCFYWGSL